jgi:hypothetical protein
MRLSVDLSIIMGLLGIASGFVSYVTAANKLRFKADALKAQNKRQFDLIERQDKEVSPLKEGGSIHSAQLSRRVEVLEKKMKDIDSKLGNMDKNINA